MNFEVTLFERSTLMGPRVFEDYHDLKKKSIKKKKN